MQTSDARPFIKWAGGKGQLLPAIRTLLPEKVQTYYEPFLGGAAVFWSVSSGRRFARAVLNDWNQELIDTYTVVRDSPADLLNALNEHKRQAWNTQEYFHEIRRQIPEELGIVARAARMIYLNKTCFNGLYRVNKSGGFNSPFGRYNNPSLVDPNNIRACSDCLNRNVTLLQGDFTQAVVTAQAGDLVYFDPPYVPVSATADFASYTAQGFDIDDQHRLSICFRALAKKDVSCILSNSDTEVVRKLYEDFEIVPVQVQRRINSKGTGRGHVGEVLVIHRGAAHRQTTNRFDCSTLGE